MLEQYPVIYQGSTTDLQAFPTGAFVLSNCEDGAGLHLCVPSNGREELVKGIAIGDTLWVSGNYALVGAATGDQYGRLLDFRFR